MPPWFVQGWLDGRLIQRNMLVWRRKGILARLARILPQEGLSHVIATVRIALLIGFFTVKSSFIYHVSLATGCGPYGGVS